MLLSSPIFLIDDAYGLVDSGGRASEFTNRLIKLILSLARPSIYVNYVAYSNWRDSVFFTDR